LTEQRRPLEPRNTNDRARRSGDPEGRRPRRTLARWLRDVTLRINMWIFAANAWVYAAAGSFIGVETVALWLGFLPLWPVAVPVMLAVVAVVGVVVQRVRERRERRRPNAEQPLD